MRQSVHVGREYLFAGFSAFAIELAIREGELVTYAEHASLMPSRIHKLTSGTCSHLPHHQRQQYCVTYFINIKNTGLN